MMPRASIIIPTFNEAENLPVLLERLTQVLGPTAGHYELIVVDDDSPDKTWLVAEAARRRYPQLRVIRRTSGEKGLAPAVVAGWQQARGELLGIIDADLQHPPEVLVRLIESFEDASVDVAIASRYASDAPHLRWNPARKWISQGASHLAQAVLPPQAHGVTDPMSGFFVIRRHVIQGVTLQPKGYKILLEVLSRGRYGRVAELSYEFGRRHRGQSKLGASVIRDYLMQLWQLVWVPTGFGRFVRYALVGGSGVIVNMGVLWALHDFTIWWVLTDELAAIESAILNNFLWNEVWTFRDRSRAAPRLHQRAWRFARFNCICAAGAAVNLGIFWILFVWLKWHYLLANGIGIILTTLWNYGLNTEWTWTRLSPKAIPPPVCPPLAGSRGATKNTVRRHRLAVGRLAFTTRRTETSGETLPPRPTLTLTGERISKPRLIPQMRRADSADDAVSAKSSRNRRNHRGSFDVI